MNVQEKKIIRIVIIGNSVAMRNRPPLPAPDNGNYGQYLEEYLNARCQDKTCLVTNTAFSRATVSDIDLEANNIIQSFPDYYVINLGVVDASAREVPFWFARILDGKSPALFRSLFRGIHHHIFKKHRRFFVKLRGKTPWIKPRKFKREYARTLARLKKETNAHIITLPVNKGNQRIENELPGSMKNYEKYSRIIKEVTENQNAVFIPLDDLNSEEHYPDGIHFSKKGHMAVALKLAGTISNLIKYTG